MAYKILKPEQSRPVKGVLFDMDGLVLDTEVLYTRFWQEAVKQLGYPITWEQTLGMRSLTDERAQQYLTSLFGPEIDCGEVRSIRIRLMDAWVSEHGVETKPGIWEFLDYLDEHQIPRAITTSSPAERAQEYLTPLGLYERFDRICSVREVACGKPEPDIYLYGAKCLGLEPGDCLALEDSPNGIMSAFQAGCMSVVIPDQDEPSPETLRRSFARAQTLADLPEMIRNMEKIK